VNPLALKVVKDRAIVMMQKLSPKTKLELSRAKTRLAIIGKDELTTDIPEFHDLYEAFPETDWNVRARGLSATRKRPVTSVGEENILCLSKRHAKTDIFIHEFAHTIHLLGLNKADLTFEPRLIETYNRAIQRGLWKDTYAGSNFKEYWAEGVQSWFDLRGENQKGVHNHVNTRGELKRYDRALYDLIAEYMPDSHFAACPK